MGKGKPQRWPLWLIAATAAAMGWVLYAVWRSRGRDDLATYGAFAMAVVIVFPGLLAWARRKSRGITTGGEELERVVEDLARAVQAQWEKAAGERRLTGADPVRVAWASPSLAIAGPAAAAVTSRRFAPLPGIPSTGLAELECGDASTLHSVYGGLGSGRLIITGAPGAGKSGAAVLLILAALQYRDQAPAGDRARIPVPVLVTAQDWNPGSEPVARWLARQLRASYPLFSGPSGAARAAAVIAARRIAVIIDGLDEIAEDTRSVALQALSQQAAVRLVILSRTTEMGAAAARQGILQGAAAIELQPVSPGEALSYLERVQLDPPPESWRALTGHLRDHPAGPLSKALDNPLALTLVRDTCLTGNDTRELLAFCATLNERTDTQAAEDITDYLLDRVLPAAYARQPGQPPPPYDLPTAQNALAKIAARMNQEGSRDLQWWDFSAWIPPLQHAVACGVAAGLAVGLAVGLGVGLGGGTLGGIATGLASGLATALISGIYFGRDVRGERVALRIGRLQPRKALAKPVYMTALSAGIAIGLMTWLEAGLGAGLEAGAAGGLALGLAIGLPHVLAADSDNDDSISPVTWWRHDRNYGVVAALAAGGVVALGTGVALGVVDGLAIGLVGGLACGCPVGIWTWLHESEIWVLGLSSAQMAVRWHTPVRLLRFLDDAKNRNVLRTVGPAYQFRHARLQDRLAATSRPR